jgi:hypothetical protein
MAGARFAIHAFAAGTKEKSKCKNQRASGNSDTAVLLAVGRKILEGQPGT